jgi:acyl carrier protein
VLEDGFTFAMLDTQRRHPVDDEVTAAVIRILVCLLVDGHQRLIDPDTRIADLGLDSLQIIELTIAIEQEFSVVVTDADLLEHMHWLTTVGSLASFVRSKRPDLV